MCWGNADHRVRCYCQSAHSRQNTGENADSGRRSDFTTEAGGSTRPTGAGRDAGPEHHERTTQLRRQAEGFQGEPDRGAPNGQDVSIMVGGDRGQCLRNRPR
jgi:hypothetical protein